jgi:uncharacterized protein
MELAPIRLHLAAFQKLDFSVFILRAMPYLLPLDAETAIIQTQHWVQEAVIGLNLCPFAKAPSIKGLIRYVVSAAKTLQQLHADLQNELLYLRDADPLECETTLLIHPWVLADFLDYNDFLDVAETLVDELELIGDLQVASFHPDYQFAETHTDDMENATNRSPFPTLHLLREDSIGRALESDQDADAIVERNMRTMQSLGAEGWAKLMQLPKKSNSQ